MISKGTVLIILIIWQIPDEKELDYITLHI